MLIVKKIEGSNKGEQRRYKCVNDTDTGKGWLKLSVYFMQHHAMKAWRCGGVSPCIITSALN